MRLGINLSTTLMIAALTVLPVCQAAAADPKTLLPEEEVTLANIKSFFDAALLTAEIDEDGDLKIEEGGMKTFIKIDAEKKLISYISAWGMKPSVSELKKLQFLNRLNDKLIFVRFCMPRPTTLWCDYQCLYDGGISPYAIVSNYRMFAKVVKGAVVTQDPDDIIGSE